MAYQIVLFSTQSFTYCKSFWSVISHTVVQELITFWLM